MSPDRSDTDRVLAEHRARFDEGVAVLRKGEVVLLAQLVADDLPGTKVEIVDSFDPEGEPYPYVMLTGSPIFRFSFDGADGKKTEEWMQPSVTVTSHGGVLEMTRWEQKWNQKQGDEGSRDNYRGSKIGGDIVFNPKDGISLLQQGLASGNLFRRNRRS